MNEYNPQGIGFAGVLTILFIALKLCRVIDWSWWLVLSPLLIGFGVFVVLVTVVFWWQCTCQQKLDTTRK